MMNQYFADIDLYKVLAMFLVAFGSLITNFKLLLSAIIGLTITGFGLYIALMQLLAGQ